jgi:CheY-like chemotaxis protein
MTKTILLVEDETFLATVIKKTFEFSGHKVAVTHNGIEALEYLETQQPPDLILCDVTMPRMNGTELYDIVSNTPRYANIPIVMMSGMNKPQLQNGNQPEKFLVKPFSVADLQTVVDWF